MFEAKFTADERPRYVVIETLVACGAIFAGAKVLGGMLPSEGPGNYHIEGDHGCKHCGTAW